MIFLPLIKLHEAEECSSVRVCCRYAVYGCEWKGRRAAEEAHAKSDCALAKISGLLEQVRIKRYLSPSRFMAVRSLLTRTYSIVTMSFFEKASCWSGQPASRCGSTEGASELFASRTACLGSWGSIGRDLRPKKSS